MMSKREREAALEFEVVTPAQAMEWLETCNTQNRPITDNVVRQYARDMAEGRWVESTTPIKFDWDGVLLDGQHRLWACAESGREIRFLVARGVDPREREVQDIGRKRSVRDILVIGGEAAGNLEVAIANRMVEGFRTGFYPTTQEQLEYFREHEEAVRWVVSHIKANSSLRGIKQASVLAPVARAWYTKDREKLERFLGVLKTGIMEGDRDSAVVLLRNFVMGLGKRIRANRMEVYGKAERAILAGLKGEKLTRLPALVEEAFPLPSEAKISPKAVTRARLVKAWKGEK